MTPRLRHVDPTRPRGRVSRTYATMSTTRVGRLLSEKIVWKLDPYLLRATRGRVGMSLVIATNVLETRGAKTDAVRRNALIYFHDGVRVTIIASKAGAANHPAWYHNLLANPDVLFGGIEMTATVVTDPIDQARLWALADRVFAPYATYRQEAAVAGRTIPLVQLTKRRPI